MQKACVHEVRREGAMSSSIKFSEPGERIYFATYCLEAVMESVKTLSESWDGLDNETEDLEAYLNTVRLRWIDWGEGGGNCPYGLENIMTLAEAVIGQMAVVEVESARVKPAKEKGNPEPVSLLLENIQRDVRSFLYVMACDLLDITRDRVDDIGRSLPKNKTKLCSSVLDCKALIPPIKKGLCCRDGKNRLMSSTDSKQVYELEQAIEALKWLLEQPGCDAL